MKEFRRLLVAAVISLAALTSYQSWAGSAQSSTAEPPTEGQSKVYSDFIQSFSKTNFRFLSNKTFPLNLSEIGEDAACLNGVELEAAAGSKVAAHSLGRDLVRNPSIQLVGRQEESAILKQRDAETAGENNPKADGTAAKTDPGVLALSEIVFDKTHRFAVLKYVFLCGSRCNSGAVLVLEKVGTHWTAKTRRPCQFLVNRENPRS